MSVLFFLHFKGKIRRGLLGRIGDAKPEEMGCGADRKGVKSELRTGTSREMRSRAKVHTARHAMGAQEYPKSVTQAARKELPKVKPMDEA